MTLTRSSQPSANDHAHHPGTELWRVDWTEVRNGKVSERRQCHHTEAAARRHVSGLLEMRASGLSVDSVYTEQV